MDFTTQRLRSILKGPIFLVGMALGLSFLLSKAFSSEKASAVSRVAAYRYSLVSPPNVDVDIAAYEERLKANPSGALDQTLLAKAYVQKAKRAGPRFYELAEAHAKESLAKLPFSNTGAKLVLAQVAQARHEFGRSLGLCDEVRKEKPAGMEVYSVMITNLLGLGRVGEAVRLADDLLGRAPTMGAYLTHGMVMAACGREREAIYDFTRAIDLEEQGDMEESSRVRAHLGRLHLRHGRHETARELFVESMRVDPGNVQACAWLGDLEMKERNFREAGVRYSDAFQRSGDASYLEQKAKAKNLEGDVASAESLRNEAVRIFRASLSNDSFGHRRQLGECLLERAASGDCEEALRLLEAEREIRRDADTLKALARAQSLLGRNREALATALEALMSTAK